MEAIAAEPAKLVREGIEHHKQGRLDRAATLYEQALEIEPLEPRTLMTVSEPDDFVYQLQNVNLAAMAKTKFDLAVIDYSADGSDATRVVFRAIDAFGNQRRYRSGQVALTLSGPAKLLGDNPFEFGECSHSQRRPCRRGPADCRRNTAL